MDEYFIGSKAGLDNSCRPNINPLWMIPILVGDQGESCCELCLQAVGMQENDATPQGKNSKLFNNKTMMSNLNVSLYDSTGCYYWKY